MPIFLPENYKTRRHRIKEWGRAQTGQIARQGTVEIWEHWDGSHDATVKPQAFRLRLNPRGQNLSLEIAELEAAIKENELALRSRDKEWHKRTAQRVEDAKARLVERAG